MLVQITSVIAPLFACASIGFIWGRLDKPFNSGMVTMFALNLGMPALIFSTLTKLQVPADAFFRIGGLYVVVIVCSLIFGVVICKIFRIDRRTYVPTMSFSNTGNMGLPLALFAFGQEGLAFGICIFVVDAICGLTIGSAIFSGRATFDAIFRNPLIYAILAALLFMVTDQHPPRWLANVTQILGGMAIPLMIISLGVSISKMQVQSYGRSVALSAIKLVFGFSLGYGIAGIFGLVGTERGVLILLCSMPIALHNYLFAEKYARNSADIAGMVLISTALSYLSLPALLWFVL